MSDFIKQFPKPEDVLDLEPEHLAICLLEYLHSIKDFGTQRAIMQTAYISSQDMVPPCNRNYDVSMAVIEGWCWLIREGFIVPRPGGKSSDEYDFSRLGKKLKNRAEIEDYLNRVRFPRELLHAAVSDRAWPLYLKGEYDTAVFQAFKEVEVAVRKAAGYSDSEFGKPLMRSAFYASNDTTSPGPLSDTTEPYEEQKSLQELFAGAYGRARNPTAHRHGVLTNPTEAFDLLVMASHLLRIVDRRSSSLVQSCAASP